MKQGKTISELASVLDDIKRHGRDFIVPVELMSMTTQNDKLALSFGEAQYKPNKVASEQLADYTDIPFNYYQKLEQENPALLADNVNHGLRMLAKMSNPTKPESRMVRTYRDLARAIVSNRYRRLDCYDLFETVVPVITDSRMNIISAEITERRMYIKAVTERLTAEVKKGDPVQYGLVISGSDVGLGSVRVEPLIYRLVCLNGMISDSAIRKFHIGRAQGDGDAIDELLSNSTRELSDMAFWAQVRDVVIGSMRPEIFEAQVNRLRIASNEKIENFDIPKVVELTAKTVGVTNAVVKKSIIAYLANGADGAGLTRWGLANAFTHAATEDAVDYDNAISLERAGAQIINLPQKQWNSISAAN